MAGYWKQKVTAFPAKRPKPPAKNPRICAPSSLADIISRHRSERVEVAALRDEATALRHDDLAAAYGKARFAKITAEVVKLQQEGERKAWGLDDLGDFDPSRLIDEQLEAIVRGR